MTVFSRRVREHEASLNIYTADYIIEHADAGNWTGASELLCQEAANHEACMNQGNADTLYALAEYAGKQWNPSEADNDHGTGTGASRATIILDTGERTHDQAWKSITVALENLGMELVEYLEGDGSPSTPTNLCADCVDAYRNGIEPGESACETGDDHELPSQRPGESWDDYSNRCRNHIAEHGR